MRFENLSGDPKIEAATHQAESLFMSGSKMLAEIIYKNDFKFNSGKGLDVAQKLFSCKKIPQVRLYTPWNPWTKAIGYSNGTDIFINSRKLPSMPMKSIVANLCHEYAHVAGFSHGNNYKTKEKCLYSVPYFISENIGKWL